MAAPPKIAPLKENDLAIKDGDVTGSTLREAFRRLFSQLNPWADSLNKALAKGLTLTDNVRCDVVTAKFTHGVPQDVALRTLQRAAGVVVLGADGHMVTGYTLSMKAAAVATIAIRFADATAAGVSVGLALFEEGQQSSSAAPAEDPFGALGIWVGSTAPATTVTYATWLTTRSGYWGWINIP